MLYERAALEPAHGDVPIYCQRSYPISWGSSVYSDLVVSEAFTEVVEIVVRVVDVNCDQFRLDRRTATI